MNAKHVELPDDLVLRVRNLGKEYKLYPSPRARFKALLTGVATHRSHWALRDVSFELRRGQCIGVIGDNGAGKSSLLKLLAGTLQPSCGQIERVGRVTAILELGAGFHPDFSGRDNLYFGGSLIGISPERMRELEPEIAAFAELGEALERPVKTYSSGMAVRLAFALVTAVQPDVLIIDEALAVGDQHFQKKCIERIMAFRNSGCTILFCSHSPYHIRHLCDAALWLRGGHVAQFGATEPVLAAYDAHTRERQEREQRALCDEMLPAEGEPAVPAPAADEAPPAPVAAVDSGTACILSVDVKDLAEPVGDQPGLLQSQDLVVTITARGRGNERPHIGFMIEQSKGVGITSLATHEDGAAPRQLPDGSWQTVLTFPELPLHSGDYVISAFLFDETGLAVYDEWFQFLHLRFIFPKPLPGLVRLPHHWS
ncbi:MULTISPECIES: ABC transporter ATP-binding protein [Pseudomonadota]|jgi:lipopolysaccharide transport system ATP-binding protein|uniref:ABC transporter n=1 Tax=Delftia tsuruhatensis TaxID=180282 RepID=A0ABM6E6Q0_9BURK|nr:MULTISPECIES: ABC transporter ATP-binding protein [Pseudomonadota]AOV03115.1 ABC transporter [Delftia tsuruhatensis]MCO5335406.1 ABC transporter ATP-binding protein [Delftia tsuruhatensis]MCR4546352.1 ABC transporter ATP-binding protein [Delftia tsuruhatensis]MDH2229801.1 ABC transporter ATP-binding protein [Delftia tsuruhatensis]MPT01076.1 ABC transporter ATP-binding protein [Pseudomonas sp.]